MNKKLFFVGLCLSLAGSMPYAAAQNVPLTSLASRRTLVDDLQTPKPGKGNVVIDQSAAIGNLIGARRYGADVETTGEGKSFLKFQGYRVQVYSGNDPNRSKEEAFKREKEIKETVSISTYITYNAPFWRLRVGDFNSHEEAYAVQRQLMQAFPTYGKEMYIVKENIQVPLDDAF